MFTGRFSGWVRARAVPLRQALWTTLAPSLVLALGDGIPRALHDAACVVTLLCGAARFAGEPRTEGWA